MAKEFKYRGKTAEELQKMSRDKVIEILPSRQKRTLKRGLTKEQNKLMEKIKKQEEGDEPLRTHRRDLVILPEMFGKKLAVYDGHKWTTVNIEPKMFGHYLGEFALTRPETVTHSGPGIGATRGTKYLSVR